MREDTGWCQKKQAGERVKEKEEGCSPGQVYSLRSEKLSCQAKLFGSCLELCCEVKRKGRVVDLKGV